VISCPLCGLEYDNAVQLGWHLRHQARICLPSSIGERNAILSTLPREFNRDG
jgi:hypothetical protein